MNDWRLRNQKKYLQGVKLYKKTYKKHSEKWDHDHCVFCWEKFSEEINDALKEGYCTENEYYWICQKCYDDFKDDFKWILK